MLKTCVLNKKNKKQVDFFNHFLYTNYKNNEYVHLQNNILRYPHDDDLGILQLMLIWTKCKMTNHV